MTRPAPAPFRTIDIIRDGVTPGEEQNSMADNSVVTSKYNAVTFIPRSLFEQFRRIANVYFLVITVLMMLGTYTSLFVSPLAPFSTLVPLILVLGVTMIKDGAEDLKRHRSDKRVRSTYTQGVILYKAFVPFCICSSGCLARWCCVLFFGGCCAMASNKEGLQHVRTPSCSPRRRKKKSTLSIKSGVQNLIPRGLCGDFSRRVSRSVGSSLGSKPASTPCCGKRVVWLAFLVHSNA